MSQKYPGGFITKSPVAPTTSAASGIWTLDQQQQAQKAGTWPSPPIFIEDIFSTYLYTGTGANQTIVNGIDLAGQGGLIWFKLRDFALKHDLLDTARGRAYSLATNNTDAQTGPSNADKDLISFNANGFSLGPVQVNNVNNSGAAADDYVSWTFREQPKFFDIVTATNVGGTNARISHNLGSVPGFVIVKAINYSGESWRCYHRSIGINGTIQLNLTDATFTLSNYWGTSAPTATDFGINWTLFSGTDYIFYFFAHDAGGFPVSGSGSTNGITCGSFTTDGSGNATVSLGYEPQWLLIKSVTFGGWWITDTMRGMSVASGDNVKALFANTSGAEANANEARPNATGFTVGPSGNLASSDTFIYVAIRRGPMKTPTVGTSVFSPFAISNPIDTKNTTNFPIDLQIGKYRNIDSNNLAVDRLRGISTTSTSSGQQLRTNTTNGEDSGSWTRGWDNTGFLTPLAYADTPTILWNFRRAPSFFDEVCWSGNSTANTAIYHNLTVTPELLIMKARNATNEWNVHTNFGATTYIKTYLNFDYAGSTSTYGAGNTLFSAPTASSFAVGGTNDSNETGYNYVAYLFATLAGVSKVGNYTGTGALQTVNCGFTSGARFVLIKRTDSTGAWFTYDSARGITASDDPYLLLNSSGVEVTNTNYVDTDTTGFKVTAAAPAGLNASGGTYLFLAIA